jgi:hypothetical protein
MRTLLTLLILAYGTAAAAESYLCIGEHSGGVKFRKGSWTAVKFGVADDKYIVNVAPMSIELTRPGQHYASYECLPTETSMGVISCARVGFSELERFVFSKRHLRFTTSRTGTYVFGDNADSDTGDVTIGACSPIASTQPDASLVRGIQSALAAKGYGPGPADGKVGTKTRKAIRTFQRSIGLPDSGRATPELLILLKAQ